MTLPAFQQKLAGAIASECRRLGAAMAHLESGLIGYANDEVTRADLVKEMQSLALNVEVLASDGMEIELRDGRPLRAERIDDLGMAVEEAREFVRRMLASVAA